MSERKLKAHIAVEAATYLIDKPYDYLIPEELRAKVMPGVRVRVGFGKGNRRTEGIVLDVHEDENNGKVRLKPILEVLDAVPVLSGNLIKLALWLRENCFCTLFDVIRTMLPSGVWHKAELAYSPTDRLLIDDAKKKVATVDCGESIAESIFASVEPIKKIELEEVFGEENVKKTIKCLLDSEMISITEYIKTKVSDKTEKFVRLEVSETVLDEYIQRKKPRASVCEVFDMLKKIETASFHELCYFTGVSPSQLKTLEKNGIVSFENVGVYRRPRPTSFLKKKEITLNEKQNAVFEALSADFLAAPKCSLLYGVTGSGKTLVYFKLIESVIKQGKTAILLVPEISLTPQLLEQVYSYFGERTAVMHSALSDGERYDEWKRMKNGEVDVVVGTRSAIFSPISDIGVIILDEEQEETYKSSSNPRYHAREVAKYRCVTESALLLLGSATPSVESMYCAKTGKYSLYTINERFNQRPLPEVIISDMRKNMSSGSDRVIGNELAAEIEKNLKNGEQTILFLNRRGSSKYIVCSECGEVPWCPNCSVPLVYHSKNSRIMCHHCGYSEKLTDECKLCGGKIKFVGFGTQRVENELQELFPNVGIIRMDMDTTSGKSSHETLLGKFRSEKVPILLGTQMITKGLDFENVTLVGVLAADQAIFNENFRAGENAFALITQVVGRAGRGSKKGRAVIQTYSPKNALICSAAEQNYDEFYESELLLRKQRQLPPFSDLITLTVISETEFGAFSAASRLLEKLVVALDGEYKNIEARVLGPTPASIVKVNNKYRYKVVINTKNNKYVRDLISRLVRDFMQDKQNKNMSVIPDINSIDF